MTILKALVGLIQEIVHWIDEESDSFQWEYRHALSKNVNEIL